MEVFVAMVSYKVKLHHQCLYEKAICLLCLLPLDYYVVKQTQALFSQSLINVATMTNTLCLKIA